MRSKILEQYPLLEPYMDDILPKKGALMLVKWYAVILHSSYPFLNITRYIYCIILGPFHFLDGFCCC
jgi:hypothetical protein